jgi:hypothetical protein
MVLGVIENKSLDGICYLYGYYGDLVADYWEARRCTGKVGFVGLK